MLQMPRIDGPDPGPPVNEAFADNSSRIDSKAQEYRRARRPLAQHIAWKIITPQDGVARCGGSATPLSPPPPGPLPAAPLPVPVPTPPAPVPGPRTLEAPCIGAGPWRGVSVAGVVFTGGVSIRGLGATTGVASLLMFFGEDPPSFSLGFGRWLWGGGGGGVCGGLSRLRTLSVDCKSVQVDCPGQMQEGEQ